MTAASPETDPAAADWQLQAHIEGESYRPNLPLLGISCPSTSLCVAVGELDTIVPSTNPTGAGDVGELRTSMATAVTPTCSAVTSVSCLPSRQCVAVHNNGDVMVSTDPTAKAAPGRGRS